METIDIARICHEANRAYCLTIGETYQHWEDASEWMREYWIHSVNYRLDNPSASIAQQHEEWKNKRIARGWKYGEVKDDVKKTHPNLVEYNALPEAQRLKDALFMRIVDVFAKPDPSARGLGSVGSAQWREPDVEPSIAQAQPPSHPAPPAACALPTHADEVAEIPLKKRAEAPEIPDRHKPKKGKE